MARNLFGPSMMVVVYRGQPRLDTAKLIDADHALSILQGEESVISSALGLTNDYRFNVIIEAVGPKESFQISQSLVGAGGTITSLGVFGESCKLHLEKLWNHNICLWAYLINTVSTPDLLQIIESGGIEPDILVSHGFSFEQIHDTYNIFELASKHGALKVVVTMPEPYSNRS
ncbi:hypothetical protein BDV09DRAFT_201523 [Aspergillus tetrazonus]